MLPQIIGPGTFTPSPLAPTVTSRAEQGAPPGAGETAAARIRPDTAERVDPPRAVFKSFPIAEEARRDQPDLFPSDPDAPAGPPPAFDPSPLERERERARDPATLTEASRKPPEEEAVPPRTTDADPAPATTDRVTENVSEVRRMAAPEAERNLDVTR